jgi:hypothetical protein
MNKVVISHIKNEEYLLPWWLKHHVNKFDSGVIIDYGSTDNSVDIIRELAPHWQVIRSVNNNFSAQACDFEVFSVQEIINRQFKGVWQIALNVTEFFIGDTSKLKATYEGCFMFVAEDIMVDPPELQNVEPNKDEPLIKQRTFGIQQEWANEPADYSRLHQEIFKSGIGNISCRYMRLLHTGAHNYLVNPGPGRHAWGTPTPEFRILWYGYSPLTQSLIDRRMAIQKSIPITDLQRGMGSSHVFDQTELMRRAKFFQDYGPTDLTDLISKYESI